MSFAELPIHKLARCFVISSSSRIPLQACRFGCLFPKGAPSFTGDHLVERLTPAHIVRHIALCNSAGTEVFILWCNF